LGEKLMALISEPVVDAAFSTQTQLPTWADCARDLLREIGVPVGEGEEAAETKVVAQ